MTIPDFTDADLARKVEEMGDDERHDLPFGVIKLNRERAVEFFSRREAADSGHKKRPAVGLSFFDDVAPCMRGPDMLGRLEAALGQGAVDIEIGWIGDFDDPNREIQMRALSSADGGLWLFMNRSG